MDERKDGGWVFKAFFDLNKPTTNPHCLVISKTLFHKKISIKHTSVLNTNKHYEEKNRLIKTVNTSKMFKNIS